jgi:putative spermidine/putrescine transport system permease protein
MVTASLLFALALAPLLALLCLGVPDLASLLANPDWAAAALRSMLLAEASVPIALLLGFPAALGLWRAPRLVRRLGLTLATLPLLAPPAWSAAGLLQTADWSEVQGAHIAALIGAHAAPAASLACLVFCAAFNRIDPALLRAAQAAGAGKIRAWRLAVLPGLGPPAIIAASVAFAASIAWTSVDTLLAPAHHPTLGVIFTAALDSGETDLPQAGLLLALIGLSPLPILGGLALLRRP